MVFPIEEVSDYRDFLKQFFMQRKVELPLYSYRMMGQKLGLETSQLFRILNKEYHLPTRCIPLAKELLGLTGRYGEYFEIIVAAAKTRSSSKQNKLYEMAIALRDVELRNLKSQELKFLGNWWIPVVRSCVELAGGKINVAEIAKTIRPQITKAQVQEALDVLFELGFITRQPSERASVTKTHFTVSGPEKLIAIRTFQKQILTLSLKAIDEIPPDERDISTLSLVVDKECFMDIREMAREFRRQVQRRVDEVKVPDTAMQLIVSLFPLTENRGVK